MYKIYFKLGSDITLPAYKNSKTISLDRFKSYQNKRPHFFISN